MLSSACVVPILSVIVTGLLAGLATAGSPFRRRVGLGIAAAALLLPFCFPDESPVIRFIASLGALMVFGRTIELMGDRTPRSAWARAFHAITLFDSRRLRPQAAQFDGRALIRTLLFAAAAVAAYRLADMSGIRLVRWLAVTAFVYAVADGLVAMLRFAFGAAGHALPPIHRDPILSRSLSEFWGERWNLAVGDWLAAHCFRPLARARRARLGLAAAFVASAMIHFYVAWAPAGVELAVLSGAFFLVHGALVGIERALGVRRWPPAAGHAWVLGAFACTLPLFLEPALRIFFASVP